MERLKFSSPLISIIIPVYNVAPYIKKCLDSCFLQTYRNLEVLAVNDGSIDDSGKYLDDYAKKESRLKVFHQKNCGVVKAREKALQEACGDYFLFVDGDDYISEVAIEKLLNAMVEHNVKISMGGISLDRDGRFSPLNHSLPFGNNCMGYAKALLTDQLQSSLCSKLILSELLNDLCVPEELKIGEDAFAVIQLLNKVDKIAIVEDPLYFYVVRRSSVTNRPSRTAVESRVLFMNYVEEYYLKQSYCNANFQDYLSYFMLNQWFAYLRMGGDSKFDCNLKNKINTNYLNNRYAQSHLPIWRVQLVKTYKMSIFLGNVFRFFFVKLRLIFR